MFLDFPNVPDVPGVPSVPRFPTNAPQAANFLGSFAGSLLNVTQMNSGVLYAGSVLSGGAGFISGTRILQQIGGAAGGIGSYEVDTAQTFAGTFGSDFTPPDISSGTEELEDDAGDLPQQDRPQWGLYKDGSPVVVADNVLTIEYKQDFILADYPMEKGAFQSYDKVIVPFGVRVRFSAGGSLANRQALLDSINAIAGDLELYDVVTPEKAYSSVNVVHQSLGRAAERGVGLLQVDVWLEQVRVDASATFSTSSTTERTPVKTPKNPTATSQVVTGTVQSAAPTTQQSAAFLNLNTLANVPRLQ